MGYRVGGQCFATSEEASDYKMSMVYPTIIADGSLKLPIKQSDGWYYGSNKIQLNHPQCDPQQPFKDGIEVGLMIASMFAVTFFVKIVVRILKNNKNEVNE